MNLFSITSSHIFPLQNIYILESLPSFLKNYLPFELNYCPICFPLQPTLLKEKMESILFSTSSPANPGHQLLPSCPHAHQSKWFLSFALKFWDSTTPHPKTLFSLLLMLYTSWEQRAMGPGSGLQKRNPELRGTLMATIAASTVDQGSANIPVRNHSC